MRKIAACLSENMSKMSLRGIEIFHSESILQDQDMQCVSLFTLNPVLVTGATAKAFVSFHAAPLVIILYRLRADLS